MKAVEYAQKIRGGEEVTLVMSDFLSELKDVMRNRRATTNSAKYGTYKEFLSKWDSVVRNVDQPTVTNETFLSFVKEKEPDFHTLMEDERERVTLATQNMAQRRGFKRA